jgi:hypothetical protein
VFSERVMASVRVQAGQETPPEFRTGRFGGRSGNVFGELPSRRAVTLMPFSSAVART